MNKKNIFIKRSFDITFSILLLFLLGWLIIVLIFISFLDIGKLGFFAQKRIGQYGKFFNVLKIRTMKEVKGVHSTLPLKNDARISRLGSFLRKNKLDELPQLINVFLGQMSFVGPRPDVPGFADQLKGEDRIILNVKPGITGPASIKFKNEEELLFEQEDPEYFNRHVIWPQKIEINKNYVKEYSFLKDIKYIYKTVI